MWLCKSNIAFRRGRLKYVHCKPSAQEVMLNTMYDPIRVYNKAHTLAEEVVLNPMCNAAWIVQPCMSVKRSAHFR